MAKILKSINHASSYSVDDSSFKTHSNNVLCKRKWEFEPGEVLVIRSDVLMIVGPYLYYTVVFDKRIGHNLFFKRRTKCGDILTYSLRVIDYELGLFNVYTVDQYKEKRKKEILANITKEIESWGNKL